MTIKQIQYYLAAYELRSVARAAEQLYVSRPVISRALSELENELGFLLFTRTGNGISPTKQGAVMYDLLNACRSALKETVGRLRRDDSLTTNRQVKIGVLNSGGSWYFQQIITPFFLLHPDIFVSVVGIQAEDTLRVLEDGSVDMAIAPILLDQFPHPKAIRRQLLYDVEWVLCMPPGARLDRASVAVGDCADLPLAVFDNLPQPFYPLDNKVLSTRKLDMIYMAVSQNYAYSVLPTELTAEWPELRTIPFTPSLKAHTYLLWNDLLPHGRAFNLLHDFISTMDLEPLRERFAQAYHVPGETPG
ncbi:MAG: LysR family transcriptional regulator [Oscillospiraceae bacterium]|nr:LysR family transcriptional regulator [Oscillospiraceae bacterium]MBR3554563.1 LysR family transcriptional regulator [Oscillospiraceae bacterium]